LVKTREQFLILLFLHTQSIPHSYMNQYEGTPVHQAATTGAQRAYTDNSAARTIRKAQMLA